MIDTVVFDLGGVLIDWNPEYVYRRLIPDEERRRYFFENICTHEWNVEQDAGRSLEDGTNYLLERHPEWEPEIRAFYEQWEQMLGGALPETVEILRKLKEEGSVRLLALTNWSAETFPKALQIFDFLHWFEGIVVSGEEKTRKPFPEIYDILIERYGLNPEAAVFIDDNLHNVEAAEEAGINGIHFVSPAVLAETLREWRVFDREETP